MTSIRSGAAVLAVVAAGWSLASASGASAQSNCQWYGTTALKQQQENERLKCGFKGAEWHSDLKAHVAWCNSTPPDAWKRSAQERDRALSACAAGKK
jgi:hypothetical protein